VILTTGHRNCSASALQTQRSDDIQLADYEALFTYGVNSVRSWLWVRRLLRYALAWVAGSAPERRGNRSSAGDVPTWPFTQRASVGLCPHAGEVKAALYAARRSESPRRASGAAAVGLRCRGHCHHMPITLDEHLCRYGSILLIAVWCICCAGRITDFLFGFGHI